MTSGQGEIGDLSRRAFLAGSLSALASGCLTGRTAGPDEDWKSAFRALGKLFHHRKTGEHEKVYLSSDNRNWVLCPEAKPQEDVYAYEIPVAMRGAEWIYLRVDGFEFGCDSCIAGYALLA